MMYELLKLDIEMIDGYRAGLHRASLTKGQHLTNQVVSMLDGILNHEDGNSVDWRIGELVGFCQWVETNATIAE